MSSFIYSKIAFMAIMSLVIITANAEEAISVATQKQLTCLAQNIYHEAGSESLAGKVAVAQVTINRAKSGDFPSTICGVVNQKTVIADKTICQFSWVCDPLAHGQRIYSAAWKESYTIAQNVLFEGLRIESLGTEALYFHNASSNPRWGLAKLDRIGAHTFYSADKVKVAAR